MKLSFIRLTLIALVISLAAPPRAAFTLSEEVDSTTTQARTVAPQDINDLETFKSEVEPLTNVMNMVDEVTEKDVVSASQASLPIETVDELILTSPDDESTIDKPMDEELVQVPPAVQPREDAPIFAEPVTTPAVIITTFDVSDVLEFLELRNQSDKPVNVGNVLFRARSSESFCETQIHDSGFIMPGRFITVSSPDVAAVGQKVFRSECMVNGAITKLEVYLNGNRVQLVDGISLSASKWLAHNGAWYHDSNNNNTNPEGKRKTFTSIKQTGSFASDYGYISVAAANSTGLLDSDLYIPPTSTEGLTLVEVFSNSRTCSPRDRGEDCDDYIKLYNNSEKPVNLASYRLRTGSRNASATTTTSYNWHEETLHPDRDELLLPAHQYFTLKSRDSGVALSLANDQGNIWIEDYFGIVSYQEVSYTGMDLAVARGKSWAYNIEKDTWQYGVPAPGRKNQFYVKKDELADLSNTTNDLKSCRDDQYRSEETNRCRNIVQPSALASCKEGQYRSEETNRCRSLASVVSALKTCADDQFRNPETNRCKRIASSEDLADCGEGRERNPETNRCRNVQTASMPLAPFATEPTIQQVQQDMLGWWMFGGVSLIAVGYAGWQWRFEAGRLMQQVRGKLSFGSKQ